MKSIKDWLNGSRNYWVGVALYKAHGDNEALQNALEQGESPFRRDKLEKGLREILDNSITGPTAKPAVTTAAHPIVLPAKPPTKPKQEEDPYREQWLPLWQEMKHLKAQLPLYPTDAERGAAAFRILELERRCKRFWEMRDYFFEYGSHMADTSDGPEMVTDENAATKRLMTVRTYVTKYRKKTDADPLNVGAREKLDKYTAELNELERRLNDE